MENLELNEQKYNNDMITLSRIGFRPIYTSKEDAFTIMYSGLTSSVCSVELNGGNVSLDLASPYLETNKKTDNIMDVFTAIKDMEQAPVTPGVEPIQPAAINVEQVPSAEPVATPPVVPGVEPIQPEQPVVNVEPTTPVVETPAITEAPLEQPVVEAPVVAPSIEPIAPAVEPIAPVVEAPAPETPAPVEQPAQVEQGPVIYGGASPIVPEINIEEPKHQIYGGANPLENTQSIPISNLVNGEQQVVQTPTAEPAMVTPEQTPTVAPVEPVVPVVEAPATPSVEPVAPVAPVVPSVEPVAPVQPINNGQ